MKKDKYLSFVNFVSIFKAYFFFLVIETNSLSITYRWAYFPVTKYKIFFIWNEVWRERAYIHAQYGRILSIKSGVNLWLGQHFPMSDMQIYVLCTHTCICTYSLKKFPLVISKDYAVLFPTVHPGSINHDINLPWQ